MCVCVRVSVCVCVCMCMCVWIHVDVCVYVLDGHVQTTWGEIRRAEDQNNLCVRSASPLLGLMSNLQDWRMHGVQSSTRRERISPAKLRSIGKSWRQFISVELGYAW